MAAQDVFQPRWLGCIEMNPPVIKHKSQPLAAHRFGFDRSQKGIFQPYQRFGETLCNRLAARRIVVMAPDNHAIARARQAKVQAVTGQFKDAAQPAVMQEACIVMEKPSRQNRGGLG